VAQRGTRARGRREGRHGASGYEADGDLTGDGLERRSVEREYLSPVALGAGDDRGVGEPEWRLREPRHQFADPRHICIAAIQQRVTLFQTAEEPDGGHDPEPVVQHLRDLGEDRERNDGRPAVIGERPRGLAVANIRTVDQRDNRRRVERDHTATGARRTSAASVTGPFFQDPTHPGSSFRGFAAR